MLRVDRLVPHGFACNGYLLTRDGKDAVLIDPGWTGISEEVERLGLRVRIVLLTHGHFDHIRGCRELQRAGAEIGCLEGEEDVVLHHNLGEVYGDGPVPPFSIDFTVRDKEKSQFCGIGFQAIATPGHSAGGVCYLVETPEEPFPGLLFTGDTLFRGEVGRTDGPTGSEEELRKSLKKLCLLEKDYRILPGHGGCSTLFHERETNRYLKW